MVSRQAQVLLAALGCAFALAAGPAAAGGGEYGVGAGDVLQIVVIENPEQATTARVDQEGRILVPPVGNVLVDGLTVSRVAEQIAARLTAAGHDAPQVVVTVREYRARKAGVTGMVNHPGVYEFRGRLTLSELISRAGGLSPPAGGGAVLTRRGESTGFDLQLPPPAGRVAPDPEILDGDSVFVAAAATFRISGEVRRPGQYRLEEGMSVARAVELAGGLTEAAARGRARIVRRVDGREETHEKAGLEATLLPDDTLIVPRSTY